MTYFLASMLNITAIKTDKGWVEKFCVEFYSFCSYKYSPLPKLKITIEICKIKLKFIHLLHDTYRFLITALMKDKLNQLYWHVHNFIVNDFYLGLSPISTLKYICKQKPYIFLKDLAEPI